MSAWIGGHFGRLAAAFTGLFAAAALLFGMAFGAAAQEAEIRALQEDLKTLGLFQGPVDGESSEALSAAIAAYVRQAGFRDPPDRAFRHFGALVRDVDLEKRIRAGKARAAHQQTVATRFGPMEVTTFRQAGAPVGFSDGRRVSIAGQRVDAALATFVECCEAKVFQVGDADVVVLRGTADTTGCDYARVYVSLTRERFSVTDREDSCAADPSFVVDNGRLIVTAQARTSLLDARWSLTPGEPIQFERLVIAGSLDALTWWVGRQPWVRADRGFRFFNFTPVADALAALLEPEALGWTFKMTLTTPVERRGEVIFVSGSYKPDETLVSVTIDLANRAVHACSFNRGTTRFASTLLRGVFSDPAASCPADIERALDTWTALGVLTGGARMRVFGFEGSFGDEAACKAGGDRVTRITARSLRLAGEQEQAITEVGVADGDYVVGTVGRSVPIKRLDDDRIDLDGEVLRRCPE
ncbi:MAG: peptidoglycan-binding protein [Rhizobiales bacterium]|nr:peptidoglycan-binding protein [Hyphomicrobiales bacterium]